jgi:polyisoprenoid-binding protein YceI
MYRSALNLTITCIFALTALSSANATTWEIDPVHTSVQFSVRHMTITNVRGEFTKVSGKILSEGKDPGRVKIEATIDASSIDTRAPKRDKHLKSADFFDVEHYPTIVFKSKKVEPAAPGKWKLTGDLTIRGVTKEVALDIEGPSEEIKDPHGNIRIGAHATTTINRKDFGLRWNMMLEGGGLLVGDNVAITIDVEAVRQAESPAAAPPAP